MKPEEAIDIIKTERECVYRQGRTGECCRDDLGCGACDLVQEDSNIMEAYDMAIEALKERPHGEWLNKNIEFGGICWATCSVCKKISDGEGRDNGFGHDYFYPNFCPNCGADMRKEGEAE